MNYLLPGIIIGLVMGLTGSGGALVAIPLFIWFLDIGLKEATFVSLIAVIFASSLNYIPNRKKTSYKISVYMLMMSFVGSYIGAPLKLFLPVFFLGLLLTLISLYSLYNVWKPSRVDSLQTKSPKLILVLSSGFVLGLLTTLTGLGGGVLLMPLFVGPLGFNQEKAVATSLFIISFSSLASLLFQLNSAFSLPKKLDILLLVLGIVVSILILKKLVSSISLRKIILIRKIVFTLVVCLALTKIF